MSQKVFEMNPVDAITAGAVGEPGHREFYIQARNLEATITLLAEKVQVQMLAQGVYQLLAEVEDKFAALSEPSPVDPLDLELRFPLEPEFRVERMELVYDPATDMVVLMAHELEEEDPEDEEQTPSDTASMARIYATRGQMRALADHALEVVASGRPICALCGQSIDAQGHVCPRRNGHAPTQATS